MVGSAGSLRTSGARSMIDIYDEKGAERNEQFRVALSKVHVIGSLQFFHLPYLRPGATEEAHIMLAGYNSLG